MIEDLVITTNSPGEVAAWVRPVVDIGIQLFSGIRITVIVPPCTFASGREVKVLKEMPGVSQVMAPAEYIRFVLLGKFPYGFDKPTRVPGVVIHLGGDFGHTAIVARKCKYPAIAYTEGLVTVKKPYRAFCVPYDSTAERVIARGVSPSDVRVIGNLMVDAVKLKMTDGDFAKITQITEPYIALLPGSRPYELTHIAPLFIDAARIISAKGWSGRFVMILSPFADMESLASVLPPGSLKPPSVISIGDSSVTMSSVVIDDKMDIPVIQGLQYDLMKRAEMAVTIPGTNTAELAVLGTPNIVNTPLNWPDQIPLEGLPGLIGGLPYLGPRLKAVAVKKVASQTRFTALPNRIANEPIVTELIGVLTASDVADAVSKLLDSPGDMKFRARRAQEVMGPTGASRRLLEEACKAATLGRGHQ